MIAKTEHHADLGQQEDGLDALVVGARNRAALATRYEANAHCDRP